MSAQPAKPGPSGGKAPRPIVINDGSDNAAAPPAQDVPTEAQAAAAPAQETLAPPPDPHLMVELATVEEMIAKQQREAALRGLLVIVIAGAALILAGTAFYRTAQLMAEGEEG